METFNIRYKRLDGRFCRVDMNEILDGKIQCVSKIGTDILAGIVVVTKSGMKLWIPVNHRCAVEEVKRET
jgi:hypothetical protein